MRKRIAVASGKGGTGKTTVAIGLALTGGMLTLLDADVEEPNCRLLLGGEPAETKRAKVMVPVFSEADCVRCGRCAEVCRFNALVVGPRGHMLFPELCHGCGACLLVCEHGAAGEGEREIGTIGRYVRDGIVLLEGLLDVGESTGVPLIKSLIKEAPADGMTIVDAPPGTACAMVTATAGADYCLLVTEPTLFGRHDLALALAVTESLRVPRGVVINRSGEGDELITELCRDKKVPILARIPYDRRLAEDYASGEFARGEFGYAGIFKQLWAALAREVHLT